MSAYPSLAAALADADRIWLAEWGRGEIRAETRAEAAARRTHACKCRVAAWFMALNRRGVALSLAGQFASNREVYPMGAAIRMTYLRRMAR